MDKLAKQLRLDAERIDTTVSAELEQRIVASLRAVTPRAEPGSDTGARLERRPAMFWWASSLTGIAAATAVIAIVNFQSRQADLAAPGVVASTSPVTIATTVPIIDWKTEYATLTGPLREELGNLQADIKKAEKKVRGDIGL